MPELSSKQASIIAIIVFAITMAFAIAVPGTPIILSGLLVVVFLSVFSGNNASTLVAATVSIAVIFITYWITKSQMNQHLFLVLMVFFVSVIVLYLKRLTAQLQFEKTHMTALFENATEGILLTDENGVVILANAAAERMFGYDDRELISKPVEWLLPQNIRQKHVQLRQTFYEHPQHRSMGSGRDLYAQKKNGDNFPVEVSLSFYYRGQRRFIIAFIVDITHRKQIEKSMLLQQKELEKVTDEIRTLNTDLELKVEERTLILKEALQRLESSQKELSEALDKERELNEMKSRFVSMASHEFRTPLSTVLSSASILSKYTTGEDQEKRDKHILRIKSAVKNLNDILEDFLSLGKLDEGRIEISVAGFSVRDFIDETIEDVKGMLKDQQEIEVRHEGIDLFFNDKKLLKNVLLNLLSNAIKFSAENSVIRINSRVRDGQLSIAIMDQGLGISRQDQEHLFSSFFRGANAINIQGTGLGLHIVKRYIELMGGSIQLESELNKGTTVSLILPTKQQDYEQEDISN